MTTIINAICALAYLFAAFLILSVLLFMGAEKLFDDKNEYL